MTADVREDVDLSDLDLLNDDHIHCHCTACQPIETVPAFSTFVALCGRRAVARTDRGMYRPRNACPDCVKAEAFPCARCGA